MDFGRMLGYTEALSKNNDRTWFHDNHRQYEQAQEDFLMVLDVMKFVLAKDAPQIGDELLFENPITKNRHSFECRFILCKLYHKHVSVLVRTAVACRCPCLERGLIAHDHAGKPVDAKCFKLGTQRSCRPDDYAHCVF